MSNFSSPLPPRQPAGFPTTIGSPRFDRPESTSNSFSASNPQFAFAPRPNRNFKFFASGLFMLLLIAGGMAAFKLAFIPQDLRQQASYSNGTLEMGARSAKDVAAKHKLTLSDDKALELSRQLQNYRQATLAQTPNGRNNQEKTWQPDITDVAIKQLNDPNYAKPFQPTDLGPFAVKVARGETPPTITNTYPAQTSIIRTSNLAAQLDASAVLPA